MQMNVKQISTLDPRINEIRGLTAQIVNRDILPNERRLWAGYRDGATDQDRKEGRRLRDSIKEKVKQAGLWAPHLPPEYGGFRPHLFRPSYIKQVLPLRPPPPPLFR